MVNSKENALSDLGTLFRNCIKELRLPGNSTGNSVADTIENIDTNDPRYAALFAHLGNAEAFNPVFQLSLTIFEAYRSDQEIVDYLVDFWDGSPPVSRTFESGFEALETKQKG